jgi:MFS family permease
MAEHPHTVVIVGGGFGGLAGLLFGFDTGVISGAILFIKGVFELTPFAEEVLVSVALVGAVCGSTLSGRFAVRVHRARSARWRACSLLRCDRPKCSCFALGAF